MGSCTPYASFLSLHQFENIVLQYSPFLNLPEFGQAASGQALIFSRLYCDLRLSPLPQREKQLYRAPQFPSRDVAITRIHVMKLQLGIYCGAYILTDIAGGVTRTKEYMS